MNSDWYNSIDVMLVDDHRMLRDGLKSRFEKYDHIRVVAEAESLSELMIRLSFVQPDVLILDAKLPDGNGISQIPQIKEKYPFLGVIVLTMYDHGRYAESAFHSKASGYVLKGEPFEELIRAIEEVHRGGSYVSPGIAAKLDRKKSLADQYGLDRLSRREFQVLSQLSTGISLRECAESLGVSEKSISTYRARLMQKLQLENNADMVRFALEAGLTE